MKKTYLTLLVALVIAKFSYAQWSTSGSYTTTSNFIGIGTTAPLSWLDVKLATNQHIQFVPNVNGGLTGASGIVCINDANTAYTPLGFYASYYYLGGGYVGIGAQSPSELLTVRDQAIAYSAASGVVKLKFDSGAGGGGIGFEKETYNTGGLRFYTQYGYGSTTEQMRIAANGYVGIGTTSPDQKLTVYGTIHSTEVKVDLSVPYPDYVFKPAYKLRTLKDVKTYIDQNHRLPEMPSEQEVAKNGLNLGEMNALLTKKVEELTLYLMGQNTRLTEQSIQLSKQQQINKSLQRQITTLTKKSAN